MVSLIELMRAAGFTAQEFEVLAGAKALSDELTQTENKAIALRRVSGSAAAASHAQALDLLHNYHYFNVKTAIMQRIDNFYALMDERTNQAVVRAEHNALTIRMVLIGFAFLLVLMLYQTSRALRVIMGGSVDEVDAQINRLGQGDFSAPAVMADAPQGSILARLLETQARLKQIDDERRQVQIELQRSETRLKEAQQLAQLGAWELDLPTNALTWSDETYRIFEIDRQHFGASYEAFLDTIHPQDRDVVAKAYTDSLIQKTPYEITHRLQMTDGRIKYVHQRCETFYGPNQQPLRSIGTVQDVSTSKLAKLELERVNRDLRLLSDCNMTLVRAENETKLLAEICRLCVESGGYLMAWVGYAEQDEARSVKPVAQAGFEEGYLDGINVSWADTERGRGPTGTAIRTGRSHVNQNILTNPRLAPWRDAAIARGYRSSVALPLLCDTQVLGALTLYAREENAFDPQEVVLLEELANDLAYGVMTLRTRAEHAAAKSQLEFLAHFDPLTHLPNRTLLRDRVEQALRSAENTGNATLALLYLDLDRFKQINDTLGYASGDQALVRVVDRLRQCVPATATISRLSGDEFAILLVDNDSALAVTGICHQVSEAFADSVNIDGNSLNISFSIGIGLFPNDGQDFDTLLKHAHAAVNNAKDAGRNTYRFFTSEMNTDLAEEIRLTGGLTQALRHQEFRLHYQPQIDIHSGRIIGVEALVRWQHPSDGLTPPGKFIALAERSGHIIQLGEWVLREACRQGRIWQDQHSTAPVVAVNLSSLQFKRGNVLEMVSQALADTGLRPKLLELELTESILLQDVEATMKTLQSLKALGVTLSIDDFGTGYSSLSYLKQLAVDKLKIDQSFVRDMLSNEDGASIVKAIIQLGHTLKLTVIAEGVETDPQLAFLDACGCDEAQGYLFSRPVPAENCTQLLVSGFSNSVLSLSNSAPSAT